MRTSEIIGIQRAPYPSVGIPQDLSDNRTGRKEFAGCKSEPGITRIRTELYGGHT